MPSPWLGSRMIPVAAVLLLGGRLLGARPRLAGRHRRAPLPRAVPPPCRSADSFDRDSVRIGRPPAAPYSLPLPRSTGLEVVRRSRRRWQVNGPGAHSRIAAGFQTLMIGLPSPPRTGTERVGAHPIEVG